MKVWNGAPIVRLLIPFAAGIIAAVEQPVLNDAFIVALFALFVVITLFTFTFLWSRAYRVSWWYGILVNITLLLMGYQLTISKTDVFSSAHFSCFIKDSRAVYVRVAAPCVEKEKSVKVFVEIIQMQGTLKPVFGKAIVYFQKDARSLKLNYGDELLLKPRFNGIATPKNPGDFDYRRFLFYKNIYHQAFVNTTDWVYTGKNTGHILVHYSVRLRNKLLDIFNRIQLKGDEFAVAAALLIGYTDKLDDDILSGYSQTGALHVLSVSGLHVAIVFVVFNSMLSFLDRLKFGQLLKAILLIFFLWFYALLTGLSPSVLRAATMFSFIVCARSFKRNSTIYNTLAASALFLLLLNPYLIMDVGFQLSYLAVAGIVFLQPLLSNLVKTDKWLMGQAWSLVSVSIAAQLATLPLGLYYFHQFPNYFLISNLAVIPLSTCIIYLGILLVVVSGNVLVLKYVALIFSETVELLNATVAQICILPYAVTDYISLNLCEMYLLYAFISILLLFFIEKNYNYLKTSLYTLITLLFLQAIEQAEVSQRKEIIVYAIPKINALGFISGKEHVLLLDSLDKETISIKRLKQNWCVLGWGAPTVVSSNRRTNTVFIQDNAIQFYDKRLLILKDIKRMGGRGVQEKFMAMDYIIVSNDVNVKIKDLILLHQPKCIIFDGCNSVDKLKKWKKECGQLKQAYHSVMDSGAFIAKL